MSLTVRSSTICGVADPLKLLQERVEASSVSDVADEVGVSRPYIASVLAGTRPPSDKILAYLGLERVVHPDEYREIA